MALSLVRQVAQLEKDWARLDKTDWLRVLAGHVHTQGTIVPDERRNESRIISVLVETRFGFEKIVLPGRGCRLSERNA